MALLLCLVFGILAAMALATGAGNLSVRGEIYAAIPSLERSQVRRIHRWSGGSAVAIGLLFALASALAWKSWPFALAIGAAPFVVFLALFATGRVRADDTFLAQRDPSDKEHLYVVLNDPEDRTLILALVSLDTVRFGADTTTVLQVGDHPFVRHATFVNYARAVLVSAPSIQAPIDAGTFRPMPPCSEALIERIRLGLFESEFTPSKIVRFCQDLF